MNSVVLWGTRLPKVFSNLTQHENLRLKADSVRPFPGAASLNSSMPSFSLKNGFPFFGLLNNFRRSSPMKQRDASDLC